MPLFPVKSITETKRLLICSEQEAQFDLEVAALQLLADARRHQYGLKIRKLQKALLQLRLARREKTRKDAD